MTTLHELWTQQEAAAEVAIAATAEHERLCREWLRAWAAATHPDAKELYITWTEYDDGEFPSPERLLNADGDEIEDLDDDEIDLLNGALTTLRFDLPYGDSCYMNLTTMQVDKAWTREGHNLQGRRSPK